MAIDYTSFDEDLLLSGLDGYVKSEGSNYTPIYRLKKGTTTVHFVTDPWTMKSDHGWHIYREVSAFDGLFGGFMLPNGMKEFPVNDQIIVTDPETGERRRQYAPRGTDPLIDLVAPSTKFPPADGRVKGSDKLAVNVIDEEGKHIVLKMSGARGAELLRALNNLHAMDDSFTATSFPWQLTLSGTGAASALTIKPLKSEPPVDLPEPYDLVELFGQIRSDVEAFVNSLRGDNSEANAVSENHETVDLFEDSIVTAEAVVPSQDKYSAMSDVRLKTLLTKAGVTVPPRSTRGTLIELAINNL